MTDKGAGALMREPPIVKIGDKKYPLRRLGLLDIERLAGIVSKVTKFIDRSIVTNIDSFTPQMAGSFLIDFLPYAFDEIVAFLATVIGLDAGVPENIVAEKRKKSKAREFQDPNDGTIRDPNVFPLGSEVKLILALAEHQDVVSFFAEAKRAPSLLKKLIGERKGPSTESSDDTDGATNTSPDDD